MWQADAEQAPTVEVSITENCFDLAEPCHLVKPCHLQQHFT